MYKCRACGEIFDEPYLREAEEDRGEYWGVPCTETMYYSECPHCGEEGDFIEGKVYYAEGKVYYFDEDCNELVLFADFEGEYFAENDDDLYDVIVADETTKWRHKFHSEIDVDIEFWEEV